MRHGDPIHLLDHTHEHLSALVVALAGLVSTDQPAAARVSDRHRAFACLAERLRDELFNHFAREEEGLFPYVRDKLADEEGALVERLVRSHDSVCRAVLRLVEIARESTPDSLAAVRVAFEEFVQLYALHSRDEAALLDSLERRLDASQRRTLDELVRGL
jgi:iron-sulfur cluster repair protein YtfE (RIC family)